MTFDQFWHRTLHRPYKLHVVDHGGNGPVIIMLHGIAASSENWNLLIPLLRPQFRCITIDLIGFGKSPKPDWYSYTMDEHLRSIELTIQRLRIQGTFVLIGHSLGSLLATRFSRQHQRRVSQLLLLSPPIYAPLESITSKRARLRNQTLLKLYKTLRSSPRMTPSLFKRLSLLLPLPKSVITYPDTWLPFMRTLEHCIEQQTMLNDIAALKGHIAVFYGNRDQVVIASTIESLSQQSNVIVHKVAAPHDITRRYAQSVADYLIVRKPVTLDT